MSEPREQPLASTLAWWALAAIGLVAWLFLIGSEGIPVEERGGRAAARLRSAMMRPGETGAYLFATFTMWFVMMVAMMVPAVLPIARVFQRVEHQQGGSGSLAGFAAGYFFAWGLFAAVAAGLQWFLHQGGLLHGPAMAVGPLLAGATLAGAGLYQLTPLKESCLVHCRSPISFLLHHWKPGRSRALRLGLRHGMYCVGCCWVLMLLMFAGGAMSVVTMAVLSIFVVAERLLPSGPWVSRIPGVTLVATGLWIGVANAA